MAKFGDVSTAEVETYLRGIDFPSGKDGLIKKARENNAPDDVMDLLNSLPDQEYHTPIDVSKAIGKIK